MSVDKLRLGRAVIVSLVVVVLVVLSTAQGLWSLSGRLCSVWSPSPAVLAEQKREADLTGFLGFARERVPYGATTLCVVSHDTPSELWFHYRLSYELYPSTVWRVTLDSAGIPVGADVPAIAWDAIVERAREKGADYAVIHDLVVPPAVAVTSMGEYLPGQSVVRFH